MWWWAVTSVTSVSSLDAQIGFALPDWSHFPDLILIILRAALALWCARVFVWVGKGTPAPFNAPREIVIVGPYRYVGNPMVFGALMMLVDAAS